MLSHLLLAVALQACPQPLTAGDPPPCSAANVPGCLPGYVPVRDRTGRVIYVCTASSPAPAAAAPPSAPVVAVPSAPAQVYAPTYAPTWAPSYPPPQPPLAYAPPREPGRGRIALVFAPSRTSDPSLGMNGGRELDHSGAAAAIELRGREGGARVRAQLQYTELGRTAELGLKYDFFDRWPLRPFLGLGLGATSFDADKDWRMSGCAFAGLDLYLDRNAFLTAEIQGRRFANRTSDTGRGLELSSRRQATVLLGIGIYL